MSSGGDDRIAEFTAFRQRMNERILAEPNQVVRRFFALDTQTYQAGVGEFVLQADVHRVEHVQGGIHDLRADAVAADHGNGVRHWGVPTGGGRGKPVRRRV
jgi:hypothetical protein